MSSIEGEAAAWDVRYSGPGYFFGREPNAFLTRELPRIPAGSELVCVADGEGRNSVYAAGLGYTVTAFDVSSVAVGKARDLAVEAGVDVDFHLAGVDDWDWEERRFDAVVAIFIQFAPPDLRSRMFAGMLRTLRPGGTLLLEGYTPRQLGYGTGGPPFVENMYTPELLHEAFAAHEIIALVEYDTVLSEGSGHGGMSALIDCIVRRR